MRRDGVWLHDRGWPTDPLNPPGRRRSGRVAPGPGSAALFIQQRLRAFGCTLNVRRAACPLWVESGHQAARLECSLRGKNDIKWEVKPPRLIRTIDTTTTVVEQLGPQTLSIVLEHNFQKPRSRSIGLGALLFTYGESIEVDEPWVVRMGRPLEQSGTMNPYQGLHAPGV